MKNPVNQHRTSLYMKYIDPLMVMRYHPPSFRVNGTNRFGMAFRKTICINR